MPLSSSLSVNQLPGDARCSVGRTRVVRTRSPLGESSTAVDKPAMAQGRGPTGRIGREVEKVISDAARENVVDLLSKVPVFLGVRIPVRVHVQLPEYPRSAYLRDNLAVAVPIKGWPALPKTQSRAGFSVHGQDMRLIAGLIKANRIVIEVNEIHPAFTGDGYDAYYMPDNNKLILRHVPSHFVRDDAALVVHEAVHAVQDLRKVSKRQRYYEIGAYLMQAAYRYYRGGRPNRGKGLQLEGFAAIHEAAIRLVHLFSPQATARMRTRWQDDWRKRRWQIIDRTYEMLKDAVTSNYPHRLDFPEMDGIE